MKNIWKFLHIKSTSGEFLGGPVGETSPSNAGDMGLTPGWGAKIPHAWGPKQQNKKQ